MKKTKLDNEKIYKMRINKAVIVISMSIKELGNAFGKVAKILRDDKFYKAICEANKYIGKNNRE